MMKLPPWLGEEDLEVYVSEFEHTGLTGGLSRALASDRLLIHDRGRVLADLAWLESGD